MAATAPKEAITRRGAHGDEIIIPQGDDHPQNPGSLLPPGNLCIQIVGRSGCGKSYLLGQIIPQISHLASVCICSTMFQNTVYDRVEEWCDRKGIMYRLAANPGEAQEALQEILDDPMWEEDPTKWGVVVFDDFSERGGGSQRDAYTDFVNGMATRFRNKCQHFIFITQTPTGVPVKYRNNVNVRYLFTVGEQHGFRSIVGDLKMLHVVRDKEFFEEVFEIVSRSKHGHLMIVNKGDEQKVYIWLDEFGAGAPYQEVDARPVIGLGDDTRLRSLITQFAGLRTQKHALAVRQRRQVKNMIYEYLMPISRSLRMSIPDLIDEIESIYDVDLA